ncbi:MAG: hypothetical protein OXL97_11100 [Chloroflexota bacterium]|nr:hypothetical protein [Chloroflexota bacterium]MDE2884952.1 hypothetical protein [Chloroflexota bacterium]
MSGKKQKLMRKEQRMSRNEQPDCPPETPALRVENSPVSRKEQNFPPELSDRQVTALPYLAAAATNEEGARMAQISISTLTRWRQDSVFRDELRRLREDAASLAHVELNGLALKSTAILANLLEDPNPRVRTQAVRIAIDAEIKLGEAARNSRRLNQLQKALTLLKNVK